VGTSVSASNGIAVLRQRQVPDRTPNRFGLGQHLQTAPLRLGQRQPPGALLLEPPGDPLLEPLQPLVLCQILGLERKRCFVSGIQRRAALRRQLSAPGLGGPRLLALGRTPRMAQVGCVKRKLRSLLGALASRDSRGCAIAPLLGVSMIAA
jgi:hypothetical protein